MKIAILGSGYIGNHLALVWSKNHFVTAVTRSSDRLKALQNKVQKTMLWHKTDSETIYQLLDENDALVLAAFADRQEDYESDYLQMAQTLKNAAIELGTPKKLIYNSSISIYGDHQGQWVDETTP